MSNATMFYTVKKGDTLSEIAQRHGTTSKQLCKINGLKNPNNIEIGQRIALNPKAVCKVTVQLLDRDRNPLTDAKVRMDYNGKSKVLSSSQSGRLPTVLTKTPEDQVKIFIARANGTWKQITEVSSGWGNKLVTLVSPKIKLDGKTMPHPKDASDKPLRDPKSTDKKPVTPPNNPETTEAKGKPHGDYGDGKGPKTIPKNDKNGLPVKEVTNDQIKLDFLKGYTGEKITEEDFEDAAKSIGCEVAVIKAVAEVESKGQPFDKKNRPTILYERHVFARWTAPKGKYDKENPDISGLKKTYKSANTDNKQLVKKGKLASYDLYGSSYPKLAKAYSLDKNAALKACSWGKFQILGENHVAAGYKTVISFVEAMCLSEKEHLNAFINFVNSNKILKNAAINKDWEKFARGYNGKAYKKYKYDQKMKEAYKKYAK